jgi:hypothetical protein
MACRIPCLPTAGGNDERGSPPIGYWLKHLDGLIEAAFERTLADEGIIRGTGRR